MTSLAFLLLAAPVAVVLGVAAFTAPGGLPGGEDLADGVDGGGEPLLTLTQLAKRVPRSRNGRPVAPSTVHRWRHPGIRGVRLECVRVGGTWFTTLTAYQAWVARLTAADTPPLPEPRTPSPAATPKTAAAARQSEVGRRLDDLGI